MNKLKTTFFLALLAGLFVVVGSLIGGRSGATVAFVIALVMNFGAYWFSDKIVLRMYGAKQVSEAEAPALYRIVRNLATRAQLPMPKVYLIESDTPNAFATGRDPQHAAVAATTGILRILSEEELTGVMAHELSHVTHRDILISTVAATIAGAISYLAQMLQWALIFGGGDREERHPLSFVAEIAVMILAPIAATLIHLAVSRSREYDADLGGAQLCGQPLWLAEALRKLHTGVQRFPMQANPSTAHLFIVSPLTGKGVLSLFSTHPPIEDRIARLEAMAGIRRAA
ncbi:MAG TPA: zinc metalloprotease HtpX [Nitrospiria bacterium]|jgi:heat shock protein HtpX|nr:zinc metalloprotease HtpX [Nitrospiria bacterium]